MSDPCRKAPCFQSGSLLPALLICPLVLTSFQTSGAPSCSDYCIVRYLIGLHPLPFSSYIFPFPRLKSLQHT
jgi:hypothetical protein